MATTTTLADINEEVSKLSAEIQNKGIDATKPAEIVVSAKKMLAALDKLRPHINQAESAFGNQKDAISQANSLTNRLNKVIAAYS